MDIVMFVFDRITALDAIGPYEVLARLPDARVRVVGPAAGTIRTDNGFLGLVADAGIDDVPSADLLVVPGGWGTRPLERDERVLDWVRRIHATTRYTTSVCTGSLILGAAGLLRGLEATTHWSARDRLAAYGATPVTERVVRQGKIFTAAGVSAGIDLALHVAAEIAGREEAEGIQLAIEYDPQPPFDSGSLERAPDAVRERLLARYAQRWEPTLSR